MSDKQILGACLILICIDGWLYCHPVILHWIDFCERLSTWQRVQTLLLLIFKLRKFSRQIKHFMKVKDKRLLWNPVIWWTTEGWSKNYGILWQFTVSSGCCPSIDVWSTGHWQSVWPCSHLCNKWCCCSIVIAAYTYLHSSVSPSQYFSLFSKSVFLSSLHTNKNHTEINVTNHIVLVWWLTTYVNIIICNLATLWILLWHDWLY